MFGFSAILKSILRGLNLVKKSISLSRFKRLCLIQSGDHMADMQEAENRLLLSKSPAAPMSKSPPWAAAAGERLELDPARSICPAHQENWMAGETLWGRHLSCVTLGTTNVNNASSEQFGFWFLFRSVAFAVFTQNKTLLPFFSATKMPDFNSRWYKVQAVEEGAFEGWDILFYI